MAVLNLVINGRERSVSVAPEEKLLWVIRDRLGLTGTKYGCGRALCGACTVLVNGRATRSCVTPVSAVAGKISPLSRAYHPTAAIHCRRPGWPKTCPSVVTANRARS